MFYTSLLRRLSKSRGLRTINLLGLSLFFACLFVSYTYVRYEFSYDRFYTNADRIVRMSILIDGQEDGRIYTEDYDHILKTLPEVEQICKLSQIYSSTLVQPDKKTILDNICLASDNLFSVFDLKMLCGNKKTAFNNPQDVIISEKLALQLFGKTEILGREIHLNSRKFNEKNLFVTGVFKDIPNNSHFHTDMFVCETDFSDLLSYYYLLLKKGTDLKTLEKKLNTQASDFGETEHQFKTDLMPLTDIHLHSKVQRELEPNGNINFIYLIIGVNVLLSIIVFFNLWLNSNLIFTSNRRYYQLLRLNGAPFSIILENECLFACLIAFFSLLLGYYEAVSLMHYFDIKQILTTLNQLGLIVLFMLSAIFVALLPALCNASKTLFSYNLKLTHFSFSSVRYMLVIQYCIVIFIIVVAICINNQVRLIKHTQLAAESSNIVVTDEQSDMVVNRFQLLKNELLKHPEITSVTTAMQLPGTVVKDGVIVKQVSKDSVQVPILIVGNDFFSFFQIKPLAGHLPQPLTQSYDEEAKLLDDFLINKKISTLTEEVVINEKALKSLGFSSPQDAIGKKISYEHQAVAYIAQGIICAVVPNFSYENVHESVRPMLVLQRNIFGSCFMIKLDQNKQGLNVLKDAWQKVNPDYSLKYTFLKDKYTAIYRNEWNAEKIINIFSVLCLIITILGLVVFMAFVIRSRTKEIGIRKVNGATSLNIVLMLNKSFLIWIFLAFVLAVPLSWYVLTQWLQSFAYQTPISWWIFVCAGLFVFLISVLAVSLQSWRAAQKNPIESINKE